MDSILIAMSGGVDSSVAAKLLLEQGYHVVGGTMVLHRNPACGSADAVDSARAIAKRLSIPFHLFDFEAAFQHCVIDGFIKSYEACETPNPCIACNRYLKFGALLEATDALGISKIATGHYAQITRDASGRYLLKKAVDLSKDQSYVLYHMTQEQLARTAFPLGGLSKSEVRALAQAYGFENASQKDSQDICFVPDGDYAGFIERSTGKSYPCGDFVDQNGQILGEHKGIIRYTIGQRKGLGLALPQPMYVCEKNPVENRVVLCTNDALFSKTLTANDLNWIAIPSLTARLRVKAKIRYKQPEQWAWIEPIDKTRVQVVFDEPQRAIARGQAVVFYDDDVVVGGGTICEDLS